MAAYAVETLQYVAPTLWLGAIAALLHGLAPRWAMLAWLGLGLAVVVAFFGPLLRLPQWLQDLSPSEHLALVPAEAFAPVACALLLVWPRWSPRARRSLSRTRHALASRPCGSPTRDGTRSPGASDHRRPGSGGPSSAAGRSW